jgi:dynein heavy chain, axonemal
MVYLEPHRLGWEPILAIWLAKMHAIIGKDLCELFERLFKWQLAAALRFVRREVKEQSPTEDSALAASTMRLIESLLDDFRPIEKAASGGAGGDAGANGDATGVSGDAVSGTTMVPGPAHSLDAATKIKWVEAVFVFSVVWAVGATGGSDDRKRFNEFFRTLTSGQTPEVWLTSKHPCFRYRVGLTRQVLPCILLSRILYHVWNIAAGLRARCAEGTCETEYANDARNQCSHCV